MNIYNYFFITLLISSHVFFVTNAMRNTQNNENRTLLNYLLAGKKINNSTISCVGKLLLDAITSTLAKSDLNRNSKDFTKEQLHEITQTINKTAAMKRKNIRLHAHILASPFLKRATEDPLATKTLVSQLRAYKTYPGMIAKDVREFLNCDMLWRNNVSSEQALAELNKEYDF